MRKINIYVYVFIIISLLIIIMFQNYINKKLKKNILLLDKISGSFKFISESIINSSKEEQVYTMILDTVMNLFPKADRGSLLIKGNDDYFVFKGLKGFSDKLTKISLKKEEIFSMTMDNLKNSFINKKLLVSSKMKLTNEILAEEYKDINCTISLPIYSDKILIGIININTTDRNYCFSQEDMQILNYIRSGLALSIKNAYIQTKLMHMANYDELTGLFNRRYFKQFLIREIMRIKRYKYESCLVLIDLDKFKEINDNYGHNTGDKALKIFSDVLRNNIRETDVYARMSGDEFVILFINCENVKVEKRMEALKEELKKNNTQKFTIDFSYGICEINKNGETSVDEILGEADKKMYQYKKRRGAER